MCNKSRNCTSDCAVYDTKQTPVETGVVCTSKDHKKKGNAVEKDPPCGNRAGQPNCTAKKGVREGFEPSSPCQCRGSATRWLRSMQRPLKLTDTPWVSNHPGLSCCDPHRIPFSILLALNLPSWNSNLVKILRWNPKPIGSSVSRLEPQRLILSLFQRYGKVVHYMGNGLIVKSKQIDIHFKNQLLS